MNEKSLRKNQIESSHECIDSLLHATRGFLAGISYSQSMVRSPKDVALSDAVK